VKKLLIQTLVVLIALAASVGSFAQSPNNTTRQRRTAGNGTQPEADTNTTAGDDKTADSGDETRAPQITPGN